MKRYYLWLCIAIFVIFAISLFLLFYIVPVKQTVFTSTTKPQPTQNQGVLLFFSPNPLFIAPGSNGSVDLMVNTGGHAVTSIQAELSFDPGTLSNITIIPSVQPFFEDGSYNVDLQDIRYANGRISYAISLKSNVPPKIGQGKVATITFSTLPFRKTNLATMSFVDKSSVLEVDNNESVLTDTNALTIGFLNSSGSANLNPLTR